MSIGLSVSRKRLLLVTGAYEVSYNNSVVNFQFSMTHQSSMRDVCATLLATHYVELY